MAYYAYILKCADGSYYTGNTTSIARRISEHEMGADSKAYTFGRRPVELVWAGGFESKNEAFIFERQTKGWSRKKKEALIRDNWDEIH